MKLRKLLSTKNRRMRVIKRSFPQLLIKSIAMRVFHCPDLQRNRMVLMRNQFDFQSHLRDSKSLESENISTQNSVAGVDLFNSLYRMSPGLFLIFSELLRPYLERRKQRTNGTLNTPSVEAMLCVTLRILAESYLDVGCPYGMDTPTEFKIFDETLIALNKGLPSIHFPSQEHECLDEAKKLKTLLSSSIYGKIAALDGMAIEI